MSDTVSNDVSTESLCTVIENSTDDNKLNKKGNSHHIHKDDSHHIHKDDSLIIDDATTPPPHILNNDIVDILYVNSTNQYNHNHNNNNNNHNNNNHSNNHSNEFATIKSDDAATNEESYSDSNDEILSTSQKDSDASQVETLSAKSSTLGKLKKSVTFDPNDEKIRKFITGEPIIDQQNPFKVNGSASLRKKKTPPPVPTKRSTLSVRKTVTQQLREREREKEKERERTKNETNNRKNNINGGVKASLASPDEQHITTEDVLKQSKYVKTYIKNPDPYFVYDPSILARIKFEELREIADKSKPTRKGLLKLTQSNLTAKERQKEQKGAKLTNNDTNRAATTKNCAFKKCSKPNYPELADIKVKVGSEPDDNFFNPAEVTKNAKKFDERVKKLHISSDDDLDELDEPLTKSESSDELTTVANNNSNQRQQQLDNAAKKEAFLSAGSVMNGEQHNESISTNGTFTNTITSKEFQQYLDKKGLTLIPTKIPSGAQQIYKHELASNSLKKVPAAAAPNSNTMDGDAMKQQKKPSVFQRLLANSIFATRRKTTPKETVPMPKPLYDYRNDNNGGNCAAVKRVVLERQSFHGRPRCALLAGGGAAYETEALRNQSERTRKSFAGGDDLSLSISSALTNAEFADSLVCKPIAKTPNSSVAASANGGNTKPIAKPPRRTLSGERLSHVQQLRNEAEERNIIIKPKVYRAALDAARTNQQHSQMAPKDNHELSVEQPPAVYFRRTLERQSLIPTKRISQSNDNKNLTFRRSASMDRNEILKRSANRGGAQMRNWSSVIEAAKPTTTTTTTTTTAMFANGPPNGPQSTSTPKRNAAATAGSNQLSLHAEQQNWERLKAIKERTDRELYLSVIQQQQQQQQQQQLNTENIYEHLKPHQILMLQQTQALQDAAALQDNNFIRGSPQRNTYSAGAGRNRQAKIIDGRTVGCQGSLNNLGKFNTLAMAQQNERSQSALGPLTNHNNNNNNNGQGSRKNLRRGYESDTEPTVMLRQKTTTTSNSITDASASATAQPRRIGGILTRDEIMQKVKEFCRKSINKTPTIQQTALYSTQHIAAASTDISPVSYASVETHQRPASRLYAAPQVAQRLQSLPQQFIPITSGMLNNDATALSTASPIYAHVIKRSSVQSNQSELYDSPQRPPYTILRQSNGGARGAYFIGAQEAQGQQQFAAAEYLPQTQYVIIDGEKLIPAQLINYQQPPNADIYAQPQYYRPAQYLQPMPGTYGYITVQEATTMPQHLVRPRLHDGRSTPLILDRSSQQASQIYWTPQHQRLQQHARLLPIEVSPRYTQKQLFPVPAPRTSQAASSYGGSAAKVNATEQQQQQQQFATIQQHTNNATTLANQQQQQQQQQQNRQTLLQSRHKRTIAEQEYSYEWESGSEAGEVQRIMERQRNSGEFKTPSVLRNLKTRMSRLVLRSSK